MTLEEHQLDIPPSDKQVYLVRFHESSVNTQPLHSTEFVAWIKWISQKIKYKNLCYDRAAKGEESHWYKKHVKIMKIHISWKSRRYLSTGNSHIQVRNLKTFTMLFGWMPGETNTYIHVIYHLISKIHFSIEIYFKIWGLGIVVSHCSGRWL